MEELLEKEKYTDIIRLNNGRRFRWGGMQNDFKACYATDQNRSGRKVIILKYSPNLNHHHHLLLLPWSIIREIEVFNKIHEEYHGFFIKLQDILIPTSPKLFEVYMVYDLPADDVTTLQELIWCSRRNINVDEYLRIKFPTYCSSSSYTPSPSPRYLNNRNRQSLSNDRLCRDLLTQLLLLVLYLKTRHIVCRNFLPDNIYLTPYNDRPLNWTTRLKPHIWNMGASIFKSTKHRRKSILEQKIDDAVMREDKKALYYYSAPELMLGCAEDHPSDMWSLGCIFAEILGAPHIVFLGESMKEQLNRITLIIGDPGIKELDHLDGDQGMMDWFKRFLLKRVEEGGGRPPIPLSDLLLPNAANPLALELLGHMLVFDPAKRITVEAALDHPYIQDFLATDDGLRKKFNCLSSASKKLVEEEGKNKGGGGGGKDEEEEEERDVDDHQLWKRILMREKFFFYNREAVLKVLQKYPKAKFKRGRFGT